jgi:hypothetical protein
MIARIVNKQAVGSLLSALDGDYVNTCFILLYQLLNVVEGNSSRTDVHEI